DGGAFFLTAVKSAATPSKPQPAKPTPAKPDTKWRTWLGLGVVYLALFTNLNWIRGILFLMWTIPALRSGETFFVEPISRRDTPGLYWVLIITWIGLSLLLFWYGWGV
ncbi:MAG: hypothetical protein HRT49_19130, partial [Cognatishimia sp.]|nr:hypothetical protein [Cognatishimia sp.]